MESPKQSPYEAITLIITDRRIVEVAPYLHGETALLVSIDDPSCESVAAYARASGIGVLIDAGESMLARYAPPPDEPEEALAMKELIGTAGRVVYIHGNKVDPAISGYIAYARMLKKEIKEYVIP